MILLDLLFPKRCFECKARGSYVCGACLKKVRKPQQYCPVCKKPESRGVTHFNCKHLESLSGHIGLWKFEGIIRKAILRLKYNFVEDVAFELANFVSKETKLKFPKFKNVILVPVPLHRTKKKLRGFNQAEIVGRYIAQDLNWKFEPDLIVRKVATYAQADLDKKSREKNVLGAFILNPKHKLNSKSCYVLFDDVWTTGSTLKEIGKVLKRKGIENVWGLTIAGS